MNIQKANSYMLYASDAVEKSYRFTLSMLIIVCIEIGCVCCCGLGIVGKKFKRSDAGPPAYATTTNYS